VHEARKDMMASAELAAMRKIADMLDGIRLSMLDVVEELKQLRPVFAKLDGILANEEELRAEEAERKARQAESWGTR
jgi:hypothetical protein